MRGRTDPNGVSMVTHPVRRGLVSAAVTVALMAVFICANFVAMVFLTWLQTRGIKLETIETGGERF